MNWYYVEQGQQAGPVGDDQFSELVRSGKIDSDTLVWREGMADWMPYGKIQNGEAISPPVVGVPDEAICAECGGVFPAGEMIRHGNARVCANCKPIFLQKLAEGVEINTGEMRYARILTRFAAVVLDGLILMAINMGLGFVIGLAGAAASRNHPEGFIVLQFVLMAIELAIGMTYEVVMVAKYGATLGKMACKIKVVTADGGSISYGRSFGRYFSKMLSGFTCAIGYIIALFDNPQKRALHDYICNTRVVYQ
ncbi:MAG TPA: RDD family protein [Verrucomicrobiae bacterium]|nr:RDD family protein [Verrucomicrobiae bacterium]